MRAQNETPPSEWYRSNVIRPDLGQKVVWIDPDGQQVKGTCDANGNWVALNGTQAPYTPYWWRPSEA